MEPYRITQATLVTYSGKRLPMKVKSEVLTKPIRIIKEKWLDTFCQMCRNNGDPFIRIELKTEPLFNGKEMR